jgi:hypothetical protein
METRALCKTRIERRLFAIKNSKFTLDLTIRTFNEDRIRAAAIYWRYRFRQHAAVCSLPALDQPRDHWRPENFVSPGIHDTSMDSPRLLRATRSDYWRSIFAPSKPYCYPTSGAIGGL